MKTIKPIGNHAKIHEVEAKINALFASITFLNRGLAFEYKGDLESAKSNYQASLDVNPDFKQAQDKLDRLKAKLKAKENE